MKHLKILDFGAWAAMILICQTIVAQPINRPTEKEVNAEKAFIEAKKERLLGNSENAVTLLKEVLELSPNNGAAYYELAGAYLDLKQKEKALENAQKAFELNPEVEWCGVLYANLLYEKGDFKQAATVFERVTKANPNFPDYYYEWAGILTKLNDLEGAIKVYDLLEQRAGVNERTTRYKHLLHAKAGRTTEAVAQLEKLVKEFPTEPQYYYILAQYYEQIGKKQKAKEVYERVLQFSPDDPVARVAIAESSKEKGDEVAYLQSLEPLFAKAEVDIDLKVKELFPYINRLPNVPEGVLSEVLKLSEIIVKTHPKDPKSYALKGDLLYYSGDKNGALVLYENTLKLDNTVFSVWEQFLYILAETQQYERLLKESVRAMDYFPNQAVVYYLNGVASGRLDFHLAAVEGLEQALMMSGRDNLLKQKIHAELGIQHHHLNQHEESDRSLEAALQLNPEDWLVLNNYSFYLANRGVELEKAKQMIQKANELKPDNATIQDTYGWVFYKLSDFDSAEKWFKKALNNGGAYNPDLLEHYGDVLFQLKKTDEAVIYWQKAKINGSTSKLLDKKISDKKLYE